jgi:hypothetical protein
VISVVSTTFRTTSLTDVSANAAKVGHKLSAAAHERRCAPARFGAILIQSDTFRHGGQTFFLKARGSAMPAFLSAFDTRVDTRLMLPVGHFILQSWWSHGHVARRTPDANGSCTINALNL